MLVSFPRVWRGMPPPGTPSHPPLPVQVAIPSVEAASCVGVLLHAPSGSPFAHLKPEDKEGGAIIMRTVDGRRTCPPRSLAAVELWSGTIHS